MSPLALSRRQQTPREELANSVSHGVGLLAAIAAVPVLVVAATQRGDAAGIIGACVFAATMVILYLTSTLYHATSHPDKKQVFRLLDHGAIFLLIAGTYTPFTLGVLRGPWGWTLFGLVWGLGLAGLTMKLIRGFRHPYISMALYLAMGWIVVIAIGPLLTHVEPEGVRWLLAGGLAYTGGVIFYAARGVPYAHFIWHLCVLAGTSCHFVAVLRYSA